MKHGERLDQAVRDFPQLPTPLDAARPMPRRCGCDQSKLLAQRIRIAGTAVETSIVLLGSPNLSERERVELVAKLLGLARNMKECPL